jgi:hypothetical protein
MNVVFGSITTTDTIGTKAIGARDTSTAEGIGAMMAMIVVMAAVGAISVPIGKSANFAGFR